jgi:hypothetical protein
MLMDDLERLGGRTRAKCFRRPRTLPPPELSSPKRSVFVGGFGTSPMRRPYTSAKILFGKMDVRKPGGKETVEISSQWGANAAGGCRARSSEGLGACGKDTMHVRSG